MARRPIATYRLDPATSTFSIEHYNWAPPLSNFFPGIAGPWGVPLWLYYVNRGQAVSSFGVRDKDGQILEFYSFNKATMRVAREGFRTFLRIDGKTLHEPFVKTDRPGVTQTMVMSAAELVLRERDDRLGLEIEVAYFSLPNLRIAGLARELRIRNLSRRPRRIECIDGLPRILPYGLDQARIKGIPRHIEGMMGVADVDGAPVFRLKQTPDDTEHVAEITGGHFYLSPGSDLARGLVVDPEAVFGEAMSYDRPWRFEAGGARAVLAAPQFRDNKTPSAFTVRQARLGARDELAIASVIGYARRDDELGPLRAALADPAFLPAKRAENAAVIDEIADRAFTASASPAFDAYARQTFLDNVVRGGMPVMFETAGGPSAFYVYSRQNGDLERDYHFFVLEPTYLSQGTGHYRSVLQNRRTDAWFFPDSRDANLRTFLDLIQLDGYNPLEVRGLSYRVADAAAADRVLAPHVADAAARATLCTWLARSFTPGELVMRLEDAAPAPAAGWDPVLRAVLALATEHELGGLHEGFWADHWHYNFDLLEVFQMVYPDQLRAALVENRTYTYFDDPDVIVPRALRSVDAGGKIRMYGAVVRDAEKLARIRARGERPYTVRTRHGEGELYRTSLLAKLLTLVVNRLATLDPLGIGIEMEGGKPGWNDSMNGLPGLFGSGLAETVELARAVRMLDDALARPELAGVEVAVHAELAALLRELEPKLARRAGDGSDAAAFAYWDAANTLKERYRAATRLGVSGDEVRLGVAELRRFLAAGRAVLDLVFEGRARGRAVSPDGVPYTYFVNDVIASRPTGQVSHLGLPTVVPTKFRQRPVRLFLEGAVHWMKERRGEAAAVYAAVKRSPIYDRKLKMYKSCESMVGESFELGRAVGAYPRGWIENESIYLHMEYKYLLEILRSGLAAEFWADAKSALIPFMNPKTYGRSTLEGASFIVSSAYADAALHGRGFQPRLSGITCEFLHIWILAVGGEHPFRIGSGGELELALAPRLPAWLFTTRATERRYHDRADGWQTVQLPAKTFAFKLLDRALVVYHNPPRQPTYGDAGVQPVAYALAYRDGQVVHHDGAALPAPHAQAVRDGRVRRLDVTLGLVG
jgi:hypothetical protein